MYDVKTIADCQQAIDRLWGFVENVAALKDAAAFLAGQESMHAALEKRLVERHAEIKDAELKLAEIQDNIYTAAVREKEAKALLTRVADEVELEARRLRDEGVKKAAEVRAQVEMELSNLQGIKTTEARRLKQEYESFMANVAAEKEKVTAELGDLQNMKRDITSELNKLRAKLGVGV